MLFTDESKYCNVLNETISIPELENVLEDLVINMRKQNEQEYKQCNIKTIWNKTAKLLMEKYLNFSIFFNPFSDMAFKLALIAKGRKR